MSDLSLVEDRPSHQDEPAQRIQMPVQIKDTRIPAKPHAKPHARMYGLYIDVLAALLGLVFLFFYTAMGSGFAVLGPWIILMGIFSYQKRAGWKAMGLLTGMGMIGISLALLLSADHHTLLCITGMLLGVLSGSLFLIVTIARMRR